MWQVNRIITPVQIVLDCYYDWQVSSSMPAAVRNRKPKVAKTTAAAAGPAKSKKTTRTKKSKGAPVYKQIPIRYRRCTRLSFDVGMRNLSHCLLFPKKPSAQLKTAEQVLDESIAAVVKRLGSWKLGSWDTVDILSYGGSKAKLAYSVCTNQLVKYLVGYLQETFGHLGLPTDSALSPDCEENLSTGQSEDESPAAAVAAEPVLVVVEEQPKRSMRMKVLSYALVTYFETLNLACNRDFRVITLSPKNKLALCDKLQVPAKKPPRVRKTKNAARNTGKGAAEEVPTEKQEVDDPHVGDDVEPVKKVSKATAKGQAYRNNKWRAVEGCRIVMPLLGFSEDQQQAFEKNKKKDDDADSLLQALSVCSDEE